MTLVRFFNSQFGTPTLMSHPSRRHFLQQVCGAAAGAVLAKPNGTEAAEERGAAGDLPEAFLTDVNVHVGQWPFRRLNGDDPRSLVANLSRHGVKRAWTGSLEGLLQRDIAGVNSRLADACREHGRGVLIPFGTINPSLPQWEEDIRRCREVHPMPGIRLYPNYHGYKLDDARFVHLAELADGAGLIVQIAVQVEDRRTQNPLMAVSPVDLSPLPDVIRRFARLKVVVLNSSISAPLATRLAGAGQLCFDLSHHEGLQGISHALQSVPLARLLFGSHSPLFMMEANLLKLRESPLTDDQLAAVAFENADRLLPA